MGLAVPNAAEQIIKIGQKNGLRIRNKHLANILSLRSQDNADGTYAGLAAGFLSDPNVGAGRWPAVPGEQYLAYLSKEYLKAGRKYGLTDDVIYTNMDTIAKMGGGDVDGDTIQLLREDLYRYVQSTYQGRTNKYGKRNPDIKPTAEQIQQENNYTPRSQTPEDIYKLMFRQAVSQIKMGSISRAQDALATINWNDPEMVRQYGQAAADLAQLYDVDSTYMKTGVAGKWTSYAHKARKLGRPFSHVFNNLVGSIQNNDFERLGNFAEINFPSRFHGLTASALSSVAQTPLSNRVIEQMIEAQNDLPVFNGMSANQLAALEDPLSQAQAAYYKKNNEIFAKLLTQGGVVGLEDKETLTALLQNWKSHSFTPLQSEDQKKALDLQQSRLNYLNMLGLVEGKTDGYMKLFDGLRTTSDASAFGTSFNASRDQERINQAIAVGLNPTMVAATQSWGTAQQIAQAKQRAYN